MVTVTLKLKEPQRIKYTDIVTIERFGRTGQRKTVKKQSKGIILKTGANSIDDKVYYQIEKSPWFVLLAGRKDIVVTNTPKEKAEPVVAAKTASTKAVTVKINK